MQTYTSTHLAKLFEVSKNQKHVNLPIEQQVDGQSMVYTRIGELFSSKKKCAHHGWTPKTRRFDCMHMQYPETAKLLWQKVER